MEKVGNVKFDLENFVKRFEEIHTVIDNIASFIYYDEMQKESCIVFSHRCKKQLLLDK